MAIYCILFLLIIVMMGKESVANSKRFALISFIYIWVIMAFRDYSVGTDTIGYIDEYVGGLSALRMTDMGFTAYTMFLSSLNLPPRAFLAISSAIIVVPIYLYVQKFSTSKSFTTLLYLTIGTFSMHMTGIRQSMAMGIALLGCLISMKIHRKYLRFVPLLILVYISSTVHGTAFICYLYPLFILFSDKEFAINKKIAVLLLSAPIFAILFNSYFSSIVNYFMLSKYEDYELGAANVNIIAYFVIPYFIFWYLTWLGKKQGLNTPIERFEYLCAFAYVLCAASSSYMPILNRMSFYFSLPILSLVAKLTVGLKREEKQLIIPILVTICITYFLMSSYGGTLRIDNYKFSLS